MDTLVVTVEQRVFKLQGAARATQRAVQSGLLREVIERLMWQAHMDMEHKLKYQGCKTRRWHCQWRDVSTSRRRAR